jgi:type II secretory pathway pseudopilin PulG
MRRKRTRNHLGFTLTELLVASAVAILIIGISIGSLIDVQGMTNRLDSKMAQQAKLRTALSYISNDIREAKQVRLTETPDEPGFQPIFNIQKPDDSIIAYYTKATAGGNDWQAPRTIYRRQLPPPEKTEPKDDEPFALLDAIADSNPLNCPRFGEDSVASDPSIGLKVFISKPPQNTSKVLICLRIVQPNSTDGIEESAFITPRAISSF